jgi:hypothetical protein
MMVSPLAAYGSPKCLVLTPFGSRRELRRRRSHKFKLKLDRRGAHRCLACRRGFA